jgi:hypothetical protein
MSPATHRMTCVNCHHEWMSLVGAWGAHYAAGCPRCYSLYWTSSPT